MTAMVGARRAVLFGGNRGFPLRGGSALAARDIDLRNNRYWQGGLRPAVTDLLTTARSSTHLLADASGVYQSFGNNVLARTNGVGAYVGGQETNKQSVYNANPTTTTGVSKGGNPSATLSVVDDMYEIAAAGLINICSSGKVFKLDNSLGGTGVAYTSTYPNGIVGNLNKHVASAFIRTNGINARVAVQSSGSSSFYSGLTYSRIDSGAVTPNSINYGHTIEVQLGGIVYFILQQLEESLCLTPPIITSGAHGTRLASDVTAANMAWFAPLDGVGATEIVVPTWSHVGDGVDRPLFEYIKDASNYIRGYVNASDQPALKIVTGGTTQTDTPLTTAIAAGRKPLTFGWSPAGGYIGDAAGNVATFGAVSLPSGVTGERVGSSQAGAYLNDILERRATLSAISQAQALALAATV